MLRMKHYAAIDACCYKTDYEKLIKTGYMLNLTKKAMDKEEPGLESFFEVISNHFDSVRKELAEETMMNKKATAEKPSNSGKLNDKDLFFSIKDIFETAGYNTILEARERNPALYEIYWLVTTYYVEKVATYHKRMNKLEAVGGSEDPFMIATMICESWMKSKTFLESSSDKRTYSFAQTKVSWIISSIIDDRDDVTSLDEPIYVDAEVTLGDTLTNENNEEENKIKRLFIKEKNKQFFAKTAVSDLILLTLINMETGRLSTGYKEELMVNFNYSPTDFYKCMLNNAAPYLIIDVNHAINHACNIESEIRKLLSWSSNTYTTHARDVYEQYIRWIKSDEPIYHPTKKSHKRKSLKK